MIITEKEADKAGQISRALRQYIKQEGISQKALANKLEVDPSAFSKMVNGKAGVPKPRTLSKLSEVLDAVGYFREARHSKSDYLLGGKEITIIRIKEYGLPVQSLYYKGGRTTTKQDYEAELKRIHEEFAEIEAL